MAETGRTRNPGVSNPGLPEALTSKTVGGLVVLQLDEAITLLERDDAQSGNRSPWQSEVRALVRTLANELREYHGIGDPKPAPPLEVAS